MQIFVDCDDTLILYDSPTGIHRYGELNGEPWRPNHPLKGLPPNYRSPYGMRWNHDRLVPNEDYPVACEIWQMGLEGKTLWSIAKVLTQRGCPPRKGAGSGAAPPSEASYRIVLMRG